MKKKILAMLMIMIMCVPFVTPIQANAASQVYREWSQADPEWGSIHLGASQYTMKSSGCLVTAIAMLICHTGSADASSFTPKTLMVVLLPAVHCIGRRLMALRMALRFMRVRSVWRI